MSFNKRMNKQAVLHLYTGILLSSEKEQLLLQHDESHIQLHQVKEARLNRVHTYCMIPFIEHSGKGEKYRGGTQTSGCQVLGLKRELTTKEPRKTFAGDKSILHFDRGDSCTAK